MYTAVTRPDATPTIAIAKDNEREGSTLSSNDMAENAPEQSNVTTMAYDPTDIAVGRGENNRLKRRSGRPTSTRRQSTPSIKSTKHAGHARVKNSLGKASAEEIREIGDS